MTEVEIYEMWTGEKHDSSKVTSIVTKLGALELAKMEIHQEQL